MGATVTTIGMFKLNPQLFSGFTVPEQLDRTACINKILIEAGNLEVMYPDGDFFQTAISYWSQTRQQTWQKMARVIYEEYDPFINIKRDEERVITQERDLSTTANSRDGVTA